MEGFLLINKPAGKTSFGCVKQVKHLVGKTVKVGHAGTLDKFATGLLILGVGRSATKYLSGLLQMPKIYVAKGKLGERTDTYDPDGIVVEYKKAFFNIQTLKASLTSFGSGYLQTPPVYSALKFQGKRLSDLKRANHEHINVSEIAINKSRWINLYNLSLLSFEDPYFTIQAHVSSGTYIRVLINDIAVNLDSCATTVELERKSIGPFELITALDLDRLDLDQIEKKLISVNDLLQIIDLYVSNN